MREKKFLCLFLPYIQEVILPREVVIPPAKKKRRVTAVMENKACTDKMDSLVNDKEIYKPLKRDPTLALQ